MRRSSLLPVLLLVLSCHTGTPPPVDEATRATIAGLTEGLKQQPANMAWIYVLASFQDRAGNTAEVVRRLERLEELGWDQGINLHDFKNSRRSRSFRAVANRLAGRQPRVQRAEPAFTMHGQRDLQPEGTAWDPVDDVFYLSSLHHRKVVRVDRAGNVRDFVGQAQDGMLAGLGMKVDAARRLLWVISTATPEMPGYQPGGDRSMLAAYDLRDGRLVRKIEATPAMLNDLTLLRDGSLFATDMGRGKVMRLAPEGEALEEWAADFSFPNGIAVSEDEHVLYVADFRGVTRMTIADRSRQKLETKTLLNGIDGMVMDRGKLVGIQNTIGSPRVVRIDPATSEVEVLEARNPLFEIPLTGALAGDEFWFVANPGLRNFNAEDPVMLRLPLD